MKAKILLISILTSLFTGCASNNIKPIHTVEYVDLNKFMGNWYVIANIPTFIETNAYNAIENYKLNNNGTIATTFTFNEGSETGDLKEYKPTGYIVDKESNALWDMQFIWPFKAEYRVIYLDKDYQTTIIGRTKRDYVWLMSRKPQMNKKDLKEAMDFIQAQGYDIDKVQLVPQIWQSQTSSINNSEI